MPIRDSMEFETRGFQHHKGSVGPFENHWLNLALALVLAAFVIVLLLWGYAEYTAQFGVPAALQPTATHFR